MMFVYCTIHKELNNFFFSDSKVFSFLSHFTFSLNSIFVIDVNETFLYCHRVHSFFFIKRYIDSCVSFHRHGISRLCLESGDRVYVEKDAALFYVLAFPLAHVKENKGQNTRNDINAYV